MVDREAMVGVVFYLDTGFEPLNPTVLRMSRLEFDALKLRAAQQEDSGRDQANNANATFKLGGNVYTHEYLVWLLSERHQTGDLPTQQQWAEAKRRREQAREEEKRKAQEEERRRSRANFEEGLFGGGFTEDGFPYFTFTDAYGRRRSGFKSSSSGTNTPPKPKVKSNKEKLADLAGVEWETADNMKLETLKRRAMRQCHPDTGGSHEKWLELTNLLERMGMTL